MRRTLKGVGISHLRKDAHGHRPHRHGEPRPCNLGNGIFVTHAYLVVLADDAGRRALPVSLGTPRLLHAAGATVTGVDVDVTAADAGELDPDACTALVQLGGPAGPGQIPVPFGLGLAVAAEAVAPVRVADRACSGQAGVRSAVENLGPRRLSSGWLTGSTRSPLPAGWPPTVSAHGRGPG